jgi:branched-chain amino acid transport system substrate-binding protein
MTAHLSSRALLRCCAAVSLALAAAATAQAATIAVVAPQQGPYALLGAQILRGAQAAAEPDDSIVVIDESCERKDGAAIADRAIGAGASAIIGFLCVETLTDALPRLKDKAIPAISVSVRSKILMEDAHRYGWPFFRLGPADGDEAEKLAETILSRFQNQPIALVDDGTIYGRELVSAVRQRLEAGGIKPVFADTYRPGQDQQLALVRRLAKAGAAQVLVGGDRADVAVMARDAAAEGTALAFLGGDVMRAANRPLRLADGVQAVALPDYAALPEGAEAAGLLRAAGVEPEGYMLPAYAAVQVVRAALTKAQADGTPLAVAATGQPVQTVIGELSFGTDHELAQNPFRLQQWRDDAFRPVGPETE